MARHSVALFLLLEVDVPSNEQQGMICYLLLNMPWVNIALKAYSKGIVEKCFDRYKNFYVFRYVLGFFSLTEESFFSANGLIEIDGTVLQKKTPNQ